MAKRSRNRDLSTVLAESQIKYGPQLSAVRALKGEARSTYRGDVRAAKTTAAAAVKGTKQARKPTRRNYNQALSGIRNAYSDVQSAFANLGAGADPFRAITAREQGGYRARTHAAKASALHELVDRAADARAGRQFAVSNAQANRNRTIGTLDQRLSDLIGERGTYTAARLGEIGQQRADKRASRQTQLDVAREQGKQSRQTARAKAKIEAKTGTGSGASGGGRKKSVSDIRMFSTELNRLSTAVSQGRTDPKGRSRSRSDIATSLTSGLSAKQTGGSAISAAKDDLALSIALDMAYDGHVSRYNQHRLHARNLKLGDFRGLVSYQDDQKRKRKIARDQGAAYTQPRY